MVELTSAKRLIATILCCSLAATSAQAAADSPKPNVRAIAAFVRLERPGYEKQIDEAMKVLDAAKAEFSKRGYETQTVRIVTQPFAELVKGLSEKDALAFLKSLDELSQKKGFAPNVGPAMMRDTDDPAVMQLLAKALSAHPNLNSSAIIADGDGIHWKTIRESAKLVRYLTDNTPRSQGNFQFTATAMLEPLGPFYPGAYHTGAGKQFSLGFESANVVQHVFGATPGDFDAAVAELTRQLTIHAKVGEEVGKAVAASSGWSFAGVDPTPAPLGDVSIGDAIERFTGARFGANGTMTAALAITTAVKAVKVKQVGYSGLMLPVMEDKLLAQRWAENTYDIDSVLAYSAVCGTGLDTVPLPGDVSEERLMKIFGDVAALAWKWKKPLSARLQPVKDKKAGDRTDFDSQYLFNTTLHPSNFAMGLPAAANTLPLFAVQIRTGAKWDASKPPQEQAHFREHSANLKRLRDAGHLIMGARYSDVGLVILAAESEAHARAMMDQDPSIEAGVFRYEVHPFNVFYPGTLQGGRPNR